MTASGNRRWLRFSLLAGTTIAIASLACLIWAAYRTAMADMRNSYAVSWVSEMVVDFMKTHDDAWPSGWDDLKESYHSVARQASDPRPPDYPWSFEELQSRVEVDWHADPKVLATAQRMNDAPPFKVIWLKDGGNAHWSGLEPNELVLKYLRTSQAKADSPR
jgi:hypothetical protein